MSREFGKKSAIVSGQAFSGSPDSLETFLKRLRDRCQDHGGCHGLDRPGRIQVEAQQALALADELGIVRRPAFGWQEFLATEQELWIGTEHLVELAVGEGRYRKTTAPPGFGLVPAVVEIPVVNLRGDPGLPSCRKAIEFVHASPVEYLERWEASNEIFQDDVRLVSVIEWKEGFISFGISQPQYHGSPAEYRDIERCFLSAGWTRLKDPSGHAVFFNYAFGVMAIDAERRNCYLTDGELQPFDVILCRPDEAMQAYLGIYPDS
ncbi:hypothetical protein OJ996_07415 [Luteolibacter sp. GHJ8]|uniref:SUKH-3 immunity protein of toxin-antitoxin system n=1 Tax=Luteolibacter rhizosphaerae TaxID=2989719 RepID=A0ABT3G0N5_9BACT|nr:hypothetical protein [Luteolibacter rhizosphaerae]MCW1913395.1 hypothetical protein [Luteolibacter rhizosphaerae]